MAKTHGLSSNPLYKIWYSMIQRCHNPKATNFYNYGGRGITVCKQWKKSFNNFYADVGKRPSRYYSLERKDNNGNYTPTNVKWATKIEQCNNMRKNRWIKTPNGRMTIAQAGRFYNLHPNILYTRIFDLGWTVKKAVHTPKYTKRDNTLSKKLFATDLNRIRKLYKTDRYTQRALANKFCIDQSTVSRVVNKKREYK